MESKESSVLEKEVCTDFIWLLTISFVNFLMLSSSLYDYYYLLFLLGLLLLIFLLCLFNAKKV